MLSRQLEHVLNNLYKEAKAARQEFMTLEHLLLALTNEDDTRGMLEHAGGNIDQLRIALTEHIESTVPKLSGPEKETQPTLGFQRVLQRAVFHVQSSARGEVRARNVLIALFSEQDSEAVSLLKQQGVSRIDIVKQMQLDNALEAELHGGTWPHFAQDAPQLDRIEALLGQTIKDLSTLTEEVKRIATKLDSDNDD